jgi:hypothetical protein
VADPIKPDSEAARDEERVEQLTHELADRLRSMGNRQEMTDYAVSILRESAEDAGQAEQARASVAKAKGDPFNPIAFGIPLLVIGAVLCATGILVGPGLGILAIAGLMVLYGLVAAMFGRSRRDDA